MNILQLAWLDYALLIALAGSLWVSQQRDPMRAYGWGLAFTATTAVCAFLAWLGFYLGSPTEAGTSLQDRLLGRSVFVLDELNAPLVPCLALIHFLTALATSRLKMRRFSFTWSLAAETIRLAMFSCKDPWILIGLMAASTIPPYIELASRGRPTRVYLLHMGLFVALLVLGQAAAGRGSVAGGATLAAVLLSLAVLVRCGTVPAHCWITDWFEHATFGIAILFLAPLSGVYAAARLVLPIAPAGVLHAIAVATLTTAVYSAGMAVVAREVRRFYAHLFVSLTSLVLLGLELDTLLALTGALCLWFSVTLSLAGFGLTLRAVEARFGRLSLAGFHGLYDHSPVLAACFLLTGLATVGFPGTLGFISTEMLVDGAIEIHPAIGVAVVAATALNGIAVVRAYLHLFTGARHVSTVELGIGSRERVAVLSLVVLILGGGFLPQPGVTTRERAASELLEARARIFNLGPRGHHALPPVPRPARAVADPSKGEAP